MQLRLFLCLCTMALPALMPSSATAQDDSNGCPVTTSSDRSFVPPDPYPAHSAQGAFWYGTIDLWTQLTGEGVWRGLPRRDSGYFNKLFLWRQGYDWQKEPKPEIVVILRRLDANAPLTVLQGGTNAFFGVSAMLIGVTFPTEGCWEVTSYNKGHTLTFIVSIQD